MANPIVSVLIDTYNHERFIAQAIESVLAQDFPRGDMEFLVVDDGSTDRTPDIVRKYEPQLRLIRKPNGGQASAFNAGIPHARGEIVAFLDGDDWWAPEKLSRVAAAFAADSALGIVGHGITMVHRDGSHLTETLRKGFQFQANNIQGAQILRCRGSFLGTSRMAIRSEILRRIGPVPEAIRVQADEYLFTLAAVLAPARILPEPLTFYRLHDANAFQLPVFDVARVRSKQLSLASLVEALACELDRHGIERRMRKVILEYTRAYANQLRLVVDGGWPWETFRTEWSLYHVTYPDASFSHLAFKIPIVLASLAVPPRTYYNAQRSLSKWRFYQWVRRRVIPFPIQAHIQREPQLRH
ncbi:MAG TPA: glycosyltransferase family A protein [Candidatus Acidoferrales bacterium]|nr:glycosyltransferase family A protein [Candidatus Acidoferrales bacterium]